jgi:hypothetical protein
MIDYTVTNRPNQLLGGLTADALLWEGRKTTVGLKVNERGTVTNLSITYAMPQDEFCIKARLIQTANNTMLYEICSEWEGKRISTRYLPDNTTEANFNRLVMLMRKRCRAKATAELITQS